MFLIFSGFFIFLASVTQYPKWSLKFIEPPRVRNMSSAFCWAWPIDPGEQLGWFLQLPSAHGAFYPEELPLMDFSGRRDVPEWIRPLKPLLGLAEKTMWRRQSWRMASQEQHNNEEDCFEAMWTPELRSSPAATGGKRWRSVNFSVVGGRQCLHGRGELSTLGSGWLWAFVRNHPGESPSCPATFDPWPLPTPHTHTPPPTAPLSSIQMSTKASYLHHIALSSSGSMATEPSKRRTPCLPLYPRAWPNMGPGKHGSSRICPHPVLSHGIVDSLHFSVSAALWAFRRPGPFFNACVFPRPREYPRPRRLNTMWCLQNAYELRAWTVLAPTLPPPWLTPEGSFSPHCREPIKSPFLF